MKATGRVDSHSAFGACFPPPTRFRHCADSMEGPSCRRDIDWFTVKRWPSLISRQPRLRYTVNALRVLRYADREWYQINACIILHLTQLCRCPLAKLSVLSPILFVHLFIVSLIEKYSIFLKKRLHNESIA